MLQPASGRLFAKVASGQEPEIIIGQIVMSRVCQLTGKRANNGMAVSHSHVRTKKLQQVNLQERRLWWAEGNRFIKLRVSTRALKTIQKKGLGAYARELGINLARI